MTALSGLPVVGIGEKLAKKLVEDDLPRIAMVQKRLADGNPFRPVKGRVFEDVDLKRGAQSPLGGAIW
jgi:hypothetical protein